MNNTRIIEDADRVSREDQPVFYEGLLLGLIEDLEGEQRQVFLDEVRTILAQEIANIYFEDPKLIDENKLLQREARLLEDTVGQFLAAGVQPPPD
jgi:hypothetical protein